VKLAVEQCAADSWPQWESFIEAGENTTFFQLSTWLRAVHAIAGQRLCRVVVVNGERQILAGLTLTIKQKAGIRVAVKPWATPYCGIIYRADLAHSLKLRINRELSNYLVRTFDWVQIETSTTFKDVLAFQENGWTVSVKNTYLLTKRRESFLCHVEPAVRRQIKKGQRQSLRLVAADDAGPLFQMYKECYERQGVFLAIDEEGFMRFWKALNDDGRAQLCYIEAAGEKLAGMIVSRYRRHHYYMLAAFRRAYARMAAPSFLLYQYLENILLPGETFDFIGANHYTPGITSFKAKFNPEEAPYLVLEHRSQRYRLMEPLLPVLKRVKRMLD
jgi:hypothetical protein